MNQNDPSNDELIELLDGLKQEAAAGRLKAITFLLGVEDEPDAAIIDSWGAIELIELANRKALEKICIDLARVNPAISKAIRATLDRLH